MRVSAYTTWLNVQNSTEKGVPWVNLIFYRFVQVGILGSFRPLAYVAKAVKH